MSPTAPETDDDALAEAFADALIERARRCPYFRLRLLQEAGLAPPAGRITQEQLGPYFGIGRGGIHEIERRAMKKLRHRTRHLKDTL